MRSRKCKIHTFNESGKYPVRKSRRLDSSSSASRRKFRPRSTASGHSMLKLITKRLLREYERRVSFQVFL